MLAVIEMGGSGAPGAIGREPVYVQVAVCPDVEQDQLVPVPPVGVTPVARVWVYVGADASVPPVEANDGVAV